MMEQNIRYSYMDHWHNLPYIKIPNFRNYYYEDKTNGAYYQSWDQILNYTAGCGFDGIEIMMVRPPKAIINTFGSLKNFKD